MANSIKKITQNCFRVLLDSIAADDTIIIAFSDNEIVDPAPDLVMIAPEWGPYDGPGVDNVVSLQDSVQVSNPVPTSDVNAAVPVSIVKTGTKHTDFQIAIHNDTPGTASATLELYIERAGR
ncbi:MAG TPA: hypothetical protein VFD36_20465 [Kofleriaceae bacterium]|nr:hypothetical protein [Kofleriaceae bacterium]